MNTRKILEKIAKLNPDIKLRPHQARVVNNSSTSQIIAHGVGSGKTLTGIAKFEKLKEQGKANKALVITPAGLRDNFGVDGVKKFTNSSYNIIGNKQEISSHTYNAPNPSKDYNIVSYEMFKRNPSKILKEVGADTVICDEFHRAKNPSANITKALRETRPMYKNHIGLTGSIVSNKVSDLYPLVDITTGGKHKLGKSQTDFSNKYLKKSISKSGKKVVTGFNKRNKLVKEFSKTIDYADYNDLKRIADMPGKKVKEIKIPMSKTQQKIYKGYLQNNYDVEKIMKKRTFGPLSDAQIKKIYRSTIPARKLSNSVGAVVPGIDLTRSAMITPKANKVVSDIKTHLKQDNRNQVVVLGQLINGGTDVIEAGLKANHIPYSKFLGKSNPGSSEKERQQGVRDYNAGKKRVILISGAGGEGISLNNTTMEAVVEPHYNPERMNQMEARGIRAGGLKDRKNRNVQVNRYVSVMPKRMGVFKPKFKTPDQFIYSVANQKAKQNNMMFDLLRSARKKQERKQKIKSFFKGGKL